MGLAPMAAYNVVYQLAGVVQLVARPIQVQIMTYVSTSWDAGRTRESALLIRDVLLVFLLVACGLVACVALYIGPFFETVLDLPADEHPLGLIAAIVGVGLVANTLRHFFYVMIRLQRTTRDELGFQLGALVVNVLGNWLLIPQIGLLGAAIATVASYGVLIPILTRRYPLGPRPAILRTRRIARAVGLRGHPRPSPDRTRRPGTPLREFGRRVHDLSPGSGTHQVALPDFPEGPTELMAQHGTHDSGSSLKSFLRLGFFLDGTPTIEIDLSRVDPERYRGFDDAELIQEHERLLRQALMRRFEPGRKHMLPLSGGLDSRALLAVLLEATDAANIHTCTFGTPGTLDYEIGCELAAKVGTVHEAMPLTATRYDRDELLDVSRRIRHQTVLFHHPPLAEWDERFGDHLVWSGILGDKLAEAPPVQLGDDAARRAFLAINTYVRSTDLTDGDDGPLLRILEASGPERSRLWLEEELNVRFRQRRFIAPHVLALGFDYATPLMDPELVDFMFSVPPEKRKGGALYRRFLVASFPELFQTRTKANEGLPLTASRARVLARRAARKVVRSIGPLRQRFPDPMINYLAFGEAFPDTLRSARHRQ